MEKFCEVLKDLVIESNLSLRTIAIESGIAHSQLSRYLKSTIPTVEISIKLAKYFDCTLDYLFGLSYNKGKFCNHYDISKFLDRYLNILNQNGITHWKFSQLNNLSESNIRKWKNGKIPKMETLITIAQKLDTSIDYLLGSN